MISNHSIQQVLDTANVQDIITDFVSLKKRGSNYIGLCPFHNEKTPSFSVSPSKNIFKCFGCGRGGNAVQFLIEHEKFSFPEAIRFLAEKYKIELEETERSQEEKDFQSVKDSLYIINERAQKFYSQQLHHTDIGKNIGLTYFKSRGFLEKTIETFGMGYAPSIRSKFTELAIKEGFKKEGLQRVGLTTQYDQDFFWNRVIFPIHGLSGKVVAFAGRIMGNAEKQPKYINSPESEIYEKRRILYGMYQAKKSIQQVDACLLVEGYTDVISLHQSGIQHVVATSGTALTHDQIRLIKRYTSNVVLLYDGDKAGQAAANRGIDLLLEQDVNAKVAVLPADHDPDSYVNEVGSSDFLQYIEKSGVDFILFKAKKLALIGKDDPIKKSELIDDIVQSLSLIPNPVKRSLYIKQCSEIFGLAEATIVASLNGKIRKNLRIKQREKLREINTSEMSPLPETESIHQGIVIEPSHFQEKDIIRILICYGERALIENESQTIAGYILSEFEKHGVEAFESNLFQLILAEYLNAQQKGQILTQDHFKNHSNSKIQSLTIDLLQSPYVYSHNWDDRWRIHLQMQKMPDENFVTDAKMACLRYLLSKYRGLSKENEEDITQNHTSYTPDDIGRRLKVQSKINAIIQELSDQLGSVVN